ncbi:MAG: SCO family protein [Alphaproteobacteria bacterium]|nr:SCO family protein [Alphaproteobacteria bacterium]MDP7123400.1 SCO family protein [Alphaproteobacteria bacterium]
MGSFIRALLPSCAVILLGGGVVWSATDGFRAFTEESARRLNVSENQPAMPLLVLEDMNGDELRLGRDTYTTDKITLVWFIYTTCPTICQIAGSEYARLRDRLAQAGLGDRVRLLSVSFDPLHDRPQEMRGYAETHGADGVIWTVARVRPGDLDLMKRSFGLRVISDEMGGYQHNAAIHLIDRYGRLTDIFDTGDVNKVFNAVRTKL